LVTDAAVKAKGPSAMNPSVSGWNLSSSAQGLHFTKLGRGFQEQFHGDPDSDGLQRRPPPSV
jgi:hypothetical protein